MTILAVSERLPLDRYSPGFHGRIAEKGAVVAFVGEMHYCLALRTAALGHR